MNDREKKSKNNEHDSETDNESRVSGKKKTAAFLKQSITFPALKKPHTLKRINPSKQKKDMCVPVIGIGASARGLEAIEQFFSTLPPVSNMAFVIIVHD